jgi:hypothetical protein
MAMAQLEGLGKLENFSDLIRTRNCDPSVCRITPQPPLLTLFLSVLSKCRLKPQISLLQHITQRICTEMRGDDVDNDDTKS